MMKHYDVIIVGGGLVGASAALALHQLGKHIALINAQAPTTKDARLFALNYRSCQFLAALNIWQDLVAYAAPIHAVHVSQQRQFGVLRLRGDDIGLKALGYVIPARHIEAALHQKISSLSNLTLFQPAHLMELAQQENGAIAKVKTEQDFINLHADLVIAADGNHSTVRKLLAIPTEDIDYKQSALVSEITLMRSHQNVAYERLSMNGTIALLPLPDIESSDQMVHRMACIWSADQEQIDELMQASDDDFVQALKRKIGYRVGRIHQVLARCTYPIQQKIAKNWALGNVLLIGNAAHNLHPMTAQGFNLALFEIAILVQELAKNFEKNAQEVLQGVESAVKSQRKNAFRIAQYVPAMLSNPWYQRLPHVVSPLVGLDLLTPVKRRFMHGMLGRWPRVKSSL